MNEAAIKRARQLRKAGLIYRKIGEELGVSGTMARNYVLGISDRRPFGTENIPFTCRERTLNAKCRCARRSGHRGIHLANDVEGRLIYWSDEVGTSDNI